MGKNEAKKKRRYGRRKAEWTKRSEDIDGCGLCSGTVIAMNNNRNTICPTLQRIDSEIGRNV
jgi:hypothetical protein